MKAALAAVVGVLVGCQGPEATCRHPCEPYAHLGKLRRPVIPSKDALRACADAADA